MNKLEQDIQDFLRSTLKEEVYKILGLAEKQPDKATDFLVTIESAETLKQLGFNLPCIFGDIYGDREIYGMELTNNGLFDFNVNKSKPFINSDFANSGFVVPSYEQVFKWLRDKGYETNIHYNYLPEVGCKIGYGYEIIYKNQLLERDGLFEEYEEAREAAITSIMNHMLSSSK